MKENILITIILAVFFVVIAGFIYAVTTSTTNSQNQQKKDCAENAKIAEAQDYTADGYNCYIVKNNKIVEIK